MWFQSWVLLVVYQTMRVVSELGEAEDEIFKRRRDKDVSQRETVVRD